MCALCGDCRKPACDQDPECALHCAGDEHLDVVDGLVDEYWSLYWAWADQAAAATPSHMNRGRAIELPARGEAARPAPDTIGRRPDLMNTAEGS